MLPLLFSLLVALPVTKYETQKTTPTPQAIVVDSRRGDDQRARIKDAIEKRFAKYGSGLSASAGDFADVALALDLDWTLLPSISMVESTGCKHYIRSTNNCFGWGSGTIVFDSHRDAIGKIGKSLATSKTYSAFQRDKKIETFAKTYNPANWQDYSRKINYFRAKFQQELDIVADID